MADILVRIVDQGAADYLREQTSGRDQEIIPRQIDAGAYAGQFAFSENAMSDPAFADLWGYIISVAPSPTLLNVDEAWPEAE